MCSPSQWLLKYFTSTQFNFKKMNKYNTIRLNQMHKALIRLRLANIIQWLTQIIQSILLIYLVHQMASYTIETSLEEASYFLTNTTMIFVAIHLARCLIRQFLKMIFNTNFRNFRFFDRVERENMRKSCGFAYLYDQGR